MAGRLYRVWAAKPGCTGRTLSITREVATIKSPSTINPSTIRSSVSIEVINEDLSPSPQQSTMVKDEDLSPSTQLLKSTAQCHHQVNQ
jgi:hypothetical protein